ncbi:PTS sugar transporter subunit IIA [Serratia odorifera]|uniref:PTS sugar transporter subunit IIA n=1 Tax=Serratia odorifera TaxID=618 RepID=UPI0018E7CF7A|nr:PTS sugar transporter subunit IIA [Serratia odorifera]MBJ2064700.1 PTS sugar transporter subunit IIA [Serratia odorifera]
MTNDIISKANIELKARAQNWRHAIQLVGGLLTENGYTTEDYTNEMIHAVETLGPYIVVAPGIALAHSRPAPSVIKTGLSLVTLVGPINFGSEENDPVELVFGLCATDSNSHIQIISRLVQFLDNDENIEFLKRCTDSGDVWLAINRLEEGI